MYDWTHSFSSMDALNKELSSGRNQHFTKCGWYINKDEYALVAAKTTEGKMVYQGTPAASDIVVFYYFSGRIADGPWGITIPTIVDER